MKFGTIALLALFNDVSAVTSSEDKQVNKDTFKTLGSIIFNTSAPKSTANLSF